ncbi:MAG: fused MFS/spermidine synthase, partial [Candidatus Zixiibacteriota bacterium]
YPLILSIGILLIATALVGLALSKKTRTAQAAAVTFIIVGIAALSFAPIQAADPERGLVAIEQSPYAEIRVVELDGVRYMLIDGGIHTVINPINSVSLFPYVNVLEIPKGYFDAPGKMLLVGLGGGSVVKNYARDGWKVDAVEIDATVTKIAYEHFGLKPEDATVYEMDGRQFLITNDKKYDLIIMDAFGSSSIPFHLVTEESFDLIKSHLSPNGVLAMNIETVGWRDNITLSIAATINRQFENVIVLPMAEPPDQLGNIIILASDRNLELKEEPPTPFDRFSAEYHRAHAWDNRFIVDTIGIQILTDERNPVDIWAERANLAARKELHEKFSETGIGW